MDSESGTWLRKCPCGKSFFQPNSYSNHANTCSQYKKNLSTVLGDAKEKYAKRRKARKGKEAVDAWFSAEGDSLDVDHDILGQVEEAPVAEEDEVAPVPVPPLMGRGFRVRAPPQHFKDFLATSAIPFEIPMFGQATVTPPSSPSPTPTDAGPSGPASERSRILQASEWKKTRMNGFNLYKSYWTPEARPHDPDLFLSSSGSEEAEGDDEPSDSQATEPTERTIPYAKPGTNPYYPFPNWSSYKLGEWFWSEGGKTYQSFEHLVSIIGDEDFRAHDIQRTNWKKIDAALGSSEFDDDPPQSQEDAQWVDDGTSWQTAAVTVQGLRFRPLVPIILDKLQDKAAAEHFHIVPSELWLRRGDSEKDVRVHSELFHSGAFLEAYRQVQSLPPEEDEDELPRYVVALMFASDETHLTSFGDAQLWPAYMHFGNEPKDKRGKSSLKLFEEIAYFQKLPDSFNDWYLERSGKNTVPSEVLRHVRREVFQAQWGVLLDDDFVHAYEHGLAVKCPDNVKRRFYLRILTYAADYPERMRLVGVRTNGDFPCPRCLVSVAEIPHLGMVSDRNLRVARQRKDDDTRKQKVDQARNLIYGKKNYAVDADKVEILLKPTSLVPSTNSFSDRLSSLGFDVYDIPAVDILHEVEIGVWKGLFTHLLRLLEAIDKGRTNIVNRRFRQTPTFGRDTIRRFRHDVSAMKQLGARDFEDLLQCSLAVFEGLFPGDHDGRVQDVLFSMAHWHALAKLRMHTDLSLEVLDSWTTVLGDAARDFASQTCSQFQTRDLEREYDARKRKEARASKKNAVAGTYSQPWLFSFLITDCMRDLHIFSLPVPHSHTAATIAPIPEHGTEPEISPRALDVRQIAPEPSQRIGDPTRGTQAARTLIDSTVVGMGAPTSLGGPEDASNDRTTTRAVKSNAPQGRTEGRKLRAWSLTTPKYHSLGDVVQYIRRTGTTDSYSTQLSERYHRFPKSRYRRTNKKDVTTQLSRIQTRQARIKRLRNQLYPAPREMNFVIPSAAKSSPTSRNYFIGKSQNQPVNLSNFLSRNANDPAVKKFLHKLKLHLFPRIIATLIDEVSGHAEDYPEDCLQKLKAISALHPSERDLSSIYFHSDTIYRHNILKIPYTTYDCREDTDIVNPYTSRRDIMCLPSDSPENDEDSSSQTANEEGSPSQPERDYVYGRVLGIFHANVMYGGSGSLDYRRRRFDFLWVRRYTPVSIHGPNTWSSKRLDRVTLDPVAESSSTDFLDPSNVLRGAHIVPRFSLGPRYSNAEDRIFSKAAQDNLDWAEYYINRFADRDMVMRFHHGMAVGHPSSQEGTAIMSHPEAIEVPMDIDPPDNSVFVLSEDDEDSDSTRGGESDDSSPRIPEPDSEEEPDIYE
ncbi:hypothetical protein FA13DRAFT_1791092 [Coprinellus micaceus]|uniref:Uncharacterized protein n=1 Tax=Coprinellus micaceus TaxID=71717 RepID=A0A4Y7TCS7_COPMI|nr:hypothetical protein FA13DRAFT_1791092 [Coprinellus micaceus]